MPGWAASAAPASSPRPGTTLSAPGGRPASAARPAKASAVRLASSAGFSTQALPAASAATDRAADDLHRVVPRDDVAGDAVRLAEGVDGVAGEIGDGLAHQLVGGAAVELDVARERPGVGAGLAERLADVAGLELGRGPRHASSTSRPSAGEQPAALGGGGGGPRGRSKAARAAATAASTSAGPPRAMRGELAPGRGVERRAGCRPPPAPRRRRSGRWPSVMPTISSTGVAARSSRV